MYDVRIVRVDDDLPVVVCGPTTDRLSVRADLVPVESAVLRAIDLATDHASAGLVVQKLLATVLVGHSFLVGVLDRCIEDVRVALIYVDADATEHAFRQTLTDLDPVVSTVGRLVEAAARPPQIKSVGEAYLVVGRRVERVRICRVHDQVDDPDRASLDLRCEHLIPAASTVRRLVKTALVVLRVQVSESCRIHGVFIRRMNHDSPEVARVRQPDVRPCLPRVHRLVHPVAPVGGAGVVALA